MGFTQFISRVERDEPAIHEPHSTAISLHVPFTTEKTSVQGLVPCKHGMECITDAFVHREFLLANQLMEQVESLRQVQDLLLFSKCFPTHSDAIEQRTDFWEGKRVSFQRGSVPHQVRKLLG
ncbi:hypothetical protein ACGLFO_06210 [Corynebacterium hesseae]|uniref:hypothetical protein n=1 Tax=Corynebacterium hesseae TaxID=2913502 RepID=UPI00373F402C